MTSWSQCAQLVVDTLYRPSQDSSRSSCTSSERYQGFELAWSQVGHTATTTDPIAYRISPPNDYWAIKYHVSTDLYVENMQIGRLGNVHFGEHI
jgi:hypothetical protein